MASALNTKINSYALNRGIEFDQAFTTTPTKTGTNPSQTISWGGSTVRPVWDQTNGPSGGNGSWKMFRSTASASNDYIRMAVAQTGEALNMQDGTYSIGFWYKTDTLPTGTSTQVLLDIYQNNTYGVTLSLYGSGHASYPSRLSISGAGGSVVPTTTDWRIEANKWYYIAIIRKIVNGSGQFSLYLNNVPLIENTSGLNLGGTSAISSIQIGSFTSPAVWATGNWWISNYYLAEPEVIDRAAVAAIWGVGNSGFKNATYALPTQPINWWTMDENTSDIIVNYGTAGGADYSQNQFNISGAPGGAYNWITGEVKKGMEFTSTWAGWDTNPSWTPTVNDGTTVGMTVNFWFKKAAPPASPGQNWMYRYYNANDNIDSIDEAGILTNGYMTFKPKWAYSGGPYAQTAVSTNMNVCDGNWHLITFTYSMTPANPNGTMKCYVDGQLKSTATDWGNSTSGSAASFSFGAASISWDEFQTYGYALTDAQVLSLYQSEYPAPTGAPLTYWNGTAWATPISMKQWNGTAWVTMDGSVYNGSAWLDIT